MRGVTSGTTRLLGAGLTRSSGLHRRFNRSAAQAFLAIGGDDRYRLWDNESKNGTTLNGKSVSESMRLYDGDLIGVGCTFILFRFGIDAESFRVVR